MLRRNFFRLLMVLVAGCGLIASPANALVRSTSTRVTSSRCDRDHGLPAGRLARKISDVVAADLKRSGLFAPIDKGAFIEKISNPDAAPRFEDWKVINAQALVIGRVTQEGDGRLKAEFRLWDTFAGQQMLGQQFYTQPENWRRVAHIIADAIYERITGEKGYFDTRIVYVAESGPKNARKRQLAIMDQDGANSRALTNANDIVLTPRFSPNRQEITYMSFENSSRASIAAARNGAGGGGRQFPGHDLRPAFLAGMASGLIMSLQQEGTPTSIRWNLRLGARRRGSPTRAAIDTSPSYSPDGSRIVSKATAAAGSSSTSGRRRLRPDAHFLRRRLLFDAVWSPAATSSPSPSSPGQVLDPAS